MFVFSFRQLTVDFGALRKKDVGSLIGKFLSNKLFPILLMSDFASIDGDIFGGLTPRFYRTMNSLDKDAQWTE